MRLVGVQRALAVLLAGMITCSATAAGGDASGFGSGIAFHSAPSRPLEIDFDGDGRMDALYVVRVEPGARLAKGVRVDNPWGRRALTNTGTPLALAIARANGARHLLHDAEFFGTPIWRAAPFPLERVARGSPRHEALAKLGRGAKGDLLLLGTEAGIDIVLYWTGRRYRLAHPDETP